MTAPVKPWARHRGLDQWSQLEGRLRIDTPRHRHAAARAKVLRRLYDLAQPGDTWGTLQARDGIAPRSLAWLRRRYPIWSQAMVERMEGLR